MQELRLGRETTGEEKWEIENPVGWEVIRQQAGRGNIKKRRNRGGSGGDKG